MIDPSTQEKLILLCALLSIFFGLYNVWKVLSVKVHSYGRGGDIELQDTGTGQTSDEAIEHQMMHIARLIQDGASTFLK